MLASAWMNQRQSFLKVRMAFKIEWHKRHNKKKNRRPEDRNNK